MSVRYQNLRDAVARLAAPADEQNAYLESILGPLSPKNKGWAYGNSELAQELDDYFCCASHMLQWGEISEEEIASVRPLEQMLERWSGQEHFEFWRREALWQDDRWEKVRECAKLTLASLPNERRAEGWDPKRHGLT